MARPRREIAMARCAGAALLAAIEVYNKPTVEYREQTFALLATNAWEILLKARLVQLGQGKIQAIYRRESGSRHYERDKATSEPITISLSQAINRVGLPREVKANIQGIIETRNRAAHLGMLKPEVQDRILMFGTAGVQNFIKLSSKWFGETINKPFLLPVGFVGHATSARGNLPKGQRALINTLDNLARLPSGTSDPDFSVVMNVQIDIKPGLSGGGSVGITNDTNAPKFKVSDEEALAIFHATYNDLVAECRKRYPDFKQNFRFNTLMKTVKMDPNCAHERRLNPNKKKSSAQMFYNLDATFVKLDDAYQRMI
ncbi:MAG: DUF3644 domain-containing protein [Caldilineaceae bacterium]|nr:DUF3644 domain-containing protein [Caldilineaceae bacterium]